MGIIKTIKVKKLSRFEVEYDTNYLYIFTDNLNRTSGNNHVDQSSTYHAIYNKDVLGDRFLYYPNSSQAVIRGLENAAPITTMANQYKNQITDDMFELYKKTIDDEIKWIKKECDYPPGNGYLGVKYINKVFGVGTYSKMNISAPKCFEYLHSMLKQININQTELIST